MNQNPKTGKIGHKIVSGGKTVKNPVKKSQGGVPGYKRGK